MKISQKVKKYITKIQKKYLSKLYNFYQETLKKLDWQILEIQKTITLTDKTKAKNALLLQEKRIKLLQNDYKKQLLEIQRIANKI